ncbi:MAG: homoserine kinase [Gemmatimonadaceae bacterium]
MSDSFCAEAPGGIGNFGPGLDVLGVAVLGLADRVWAVREEEPGVRIDRPGHSDLPRDASRHAAGIAATEVLRLCGHSEVGISLRIEKGLPLSGGQGGSAASAVAAAVAVDALLGKTLTTDELIRAALAAESKVSGRHADNIIPALVGGIVLIRSLEEMDFVKLSVPESLHLVLVHPAYRVSTQDARRALPEWVDRPTAIHQSAQVGAIVHALATGDLELLGRAMDDRLAEPKRTPLLPGFTEARHAAIEAGAFGCSISGAGPSVFAVVDDMTLGTSVALAMVEAYERRNVKAAWRVTRVDEQGARLLPALDAPPVLRLV